MTEVKLLSINQAARLMGINEKIISDEIKMGKLKVFRLFGMKNAKIPLWALREWQEQNTGVFNG